MRFQWKILLIGAFAAVVLTQFTNCDVYTESSVFNGGSTQACEGLDCVVRDPQMLELGTVGRVFVQSTQVAADVGGECNEANYPTNRVVWQIRQNGVTIRDCAATSHCTVCVNGRFQAYIFFGIQPANDMQVVIEIIGYDSAGAPFTNPLLGRKTIQVQVP